MSHDCAGYNVVARIPGDLVIGRHSSHQVTGFYLQAPGRYQGRADFEFLSDRCAVGGGGFVACRARLSSLVESKLGLLREGPPHVYSQGDDLSYHLGASLAEAIAVVAWLYVI
ncbi:MAG TPA: hypothetical protein G4O12_09500 [Dehalococcoidia bacterium]|nr:hypothetical protein [Dehalococcoidia bacterium]